MESKKILIICKGFYPENTPRSFRATELALEFARQFHHVTVITNAKDFDYTDFVSKNKINLISFGRLRFRHISYYPPTILGTLRRKFRRLLFMLFNYPDIEIMWRLGKYLKNVDGYDLLISVAVPYPIHWGVAWARTKNHRIAKTWVADCGDPYFGNTLESFRIPFYFAYIEKWFSRKADFITIPFENLKEKFFKEFHDKIRVIPQGFNFNELDICKETVRNKIPTFAYAGGVAINGIRSPVKIIEYLIGKDYNYEFHLFCSTGIDFLIPMAKKSKGRIILHDPLPRKELLKVLSKMDFLVNLLNTDLLSVQVPSKLIDYSLTGRPILNINPSEPEFEILEEFLSFNFSRAYQINNLEQFNIQNVVEQFLMLCGQNQINEKCLEF
jgi:hypothetical protein